RIENTGAKLFVSNERQGGAKSAVRRGPLLGLEMNRASVVVRQRKVLRLGAGPILVAHLLWLRGRVQALDHLCRQRDGTLGVPLRAEIDFSDEQHGVLARIRVRDDLLGLG